MNLFPGQIASIALVYPGNVLYRSSGLKVRFGLTGFLGQNL